MRRHAIILIAVALVAAAAFVSTELFVSAQGRMVSYGETVNGTISSGAVETWAFDGISGDVVTIDLGRTAGNLTPLVTLEDPAGGVVLRMDWPAVGPAGFSATVSLRATGRYSLSVAGKDATTGDYALTLILVEDDPGDGVLAYGHVASGSITDESFRTFWSFRGTRDDVIDVNMTATRGDLDAELVLYSPGGVVLDTADSGGTGLDAALLAYRLPTTGVYSIEARRAGSDSGTAGTTQGDYNLALTLRAAGESDAAPTTAPLALASEARGRLTTESPSALYSIEGEGAVAVALDTLDPSQVATVTVLTPGQALIDSVTGLAPLRAGVILPEAGTYWVEVTTPGLLQPVDYALKITPLQVATGISRGLQPGMAPRIIEAADAARGTAWHFAGQPGDLIAVEITPDAPVLDAGFELLAPDGTLVVSRLIGHNVQQPLTLSTAGLYEVRVDPLPVGYHMAFEQNGAAGLAFDQHTTPETRSALNPNVANNVTGDVTAAGSDAWVLDLTGPQTMLFELTRTGSNALLALAIEDPEGVWLSQTVTNSFAGRAALQYSFEQAGRYRVLVIEASGSTAARYSLQAAPVDGGLLTNAVAVKGVLTANAPRDVWSFDAGTGALLDLDIEAASVPDSFLFGPDGLLVASGDQLSGFRLQEGGRYRLFVQQQGVVNRNPYWLTVTPSSSQAQAAALPYASDVPEVFVTSYQATPQPDRVVIPDVAMPQLAVDLETARSMEYEDLEPDTIPTDQRYVVRSLGVGAGAWLSITATAIEGDVAPGVLVVNAEGRVLAEELPGQSSATMLNQRISDAGTYYAVVRLPSGTPFTLWAEVQADIDETLPGMLDGHAIAFGETVHDEIIEPGAVSDMLFYGHEGDQISIALTRVAGSANLALILRDRDGVLIREEQMPADATVAQLDEVILSGSGVYRLEVQRPEDETEPARFAVHLGLNQATEEVERSGGQLAGTRYGSLAAGNAAHTWLFDARAGESVTIHAEPVSMGGPTTLQVELADSTGTVFLREAARIGQGGITLDDVLLPRNGIYQVIVSGGQRQAGLYRLTLTRDDTATEDVPGAISYGATAQHVLTNEDVLDVWTFAGSHGDVVSVSLHSDRGDAVLPGFQLRTQNGQVLATVVGDGSPAALRLERLPLPFDGFYTIAVGSLEGEPFGASAYELSLQLVDTSARAIGTRLDYDQRVASTLFVSDPVDTWVFEAQTGDVVTVELADVTPGLTPTLTLYTTDWHTSAVSGQPGILAAGQQSLEFIAPASGTYALVVEDVARAGGNYAILLRAESATGRPSQTVIPGLTQTGEIGETRLTEAWTFMAEAGSSVSVEARPDSRSELVPAVTLLGVDGQVFATDAAVPDESARIEALQLPHAGLYTVLVSRALGADGRSAGRYTLDVSLTEAIQTIPATLIFGQVDRGLLNDEQPAFRWDFEGTQGNAAHVLVEATSGDLDPVVHVYAPSGVLIATGDDEQGNDVSITFSLPETGTYWVDVLRFGAGSGATSGNYAVVVEEVYRTAPLEPETLLVYGDRVTGTTNGENRSDFWTFAGQAGDTIAALIQFPLDDAPLQLMLHDSAGETLLTGERDRGDVLITNYTLPASALYVLEVRRPGDALAAHSPYTLDLTLLDIVETTPGSGGVLLPGQPEAGRFDLAPALHTWIFQAQAGQPVALTINRLRGQMALDVVLIAPDGSQMFASRVDPGTTNLVSAGPLNITLDGVYTLHLSAHEAALGLDYRVNVQPVSAEMIVPQALAVDTDGFGALTDFETSQWWHFDAQAGEQLALRVAALNGNLRPTLLLWGPDGRPLHEGLTDHDGQASINGVVAETSGTYRVQVGREGDASGGSYRLMLRKQAAISVQAAQAPDVIFGQSQSGVLTSSEPQYVGFSGQAGDVLALAVTVSEEGTPPTLMIETEDGRTLSTTSQSAAAETFIPAFVLPETGRYVARIAGEPDVFTFTVHRRDASEASAAVVRTLVANQAAVEGLNTPDSTTLWSFNGQQGDVYTFAVDTTGGGLRADVALYGPRGFISSAVETVNTAAGAELGPVRLPDNGEYLLLVSSWMGASRGGFNLRMTPAEAGVSGSAGGAIAAPGTTVVGGLIAEDNTDEWTFAGQAGDVVTVRIEQTGGTGALSATLTTTDGAQVAETQAGTSFVGVEMMDVVLPVAGTYVVNVTGNVATGNAVEYRLSLLAGAQLQAGIGRAEGIVYGDVREGVLSPPSAAWVFYGQAGDVVLAELFDTSAPATLMLVGPGGEVLYAAPRLANVQLPTTGFYGLIVTSSEEITYRLQLEKSATGALLQGVLHDQVQGVLSAAAPVHEWTFAADYAGDYVFKAQTLAYAGARVDVAVVSGDGSNIATGNAVGLRSTQAIARLEAGRTYKVVVSGVPLVGDGRYALSVEPASVTRSGGTLVLPDANIGRITAARLVDEWQYVAGAAERVVINVARVEGDLIPHLIVYDATSAQVDEVIAAEDGTLVATLNLPDAGRYTFEVTRAGGVSGQTRGDYTISIATPE